MVKNVHISYKRNIGHEKMIDAICRGLHAADIYCFIDTEQLGIRDNIKEFEEKIGKSDHPIIIVSDAYMKSLQCMYEMACIWENGKVEERVVCLDDLDGIQRDYTKEIEIKDYWAAQSRDRALALAKHPLDEYIPEDLRKIVKIQKYVDIFWRYVTDNISGGIVEYSENDAEKLIALLKVMDEPKQHIELQPVKISEPMGRTINMSGSNPTYIENNYGVVNVGSSTNTPTVHNEAYFQGIERQILKLLDGAQAMIDVCVAWFTNERLLDMLLKKKADGVRVRVIIYHDGVNAKHGVDLSGLEHKEVRGERKGLMHEKYCVIDNHTVISGSYNWTENAEHKNDEQITVNEDVVMASKFTRDFNQKWDRGE